MISLTAIYTSQAKTYNFYDLTNKIQCHQTLKVYMFHIIEYIIIYVKRCNEFYS